MRWLRGRCNGRGISRVVGDRVELHISMIHDVVMSQRCNSPEQASAISGAWRNALVSRGWLPARRSSPSSRSPAADPRHSEDHSSSHHIGGDLGTPHGLSQSMNRFASRAVCTSIGAPLHAKLSSTRQNAPLACHSPMCSRDVGVDHDSRRRPHDQCIRANGSGKRRIRAAGPRGRSITDIR